MEIEAKKLVKTFKGRKVLDSVSFRIKGPGIVGYLGPNGAGKTTTFKIFSNLISADSGDAYTNGINTRNYKNALREAAVLVGDPEPYSEMTIKEFLMFIGSIREMSKKTTEKRIIELKNSLNLEDLDKNCGILSKGNRQRVILAATLLPNTDVIMLDEPTDGLDPMEVYDIKRILKQIGKKKLIFLSSHILEEVRELCREIICIDHGRIIASGSVKTIERKFGRGKGLEKAYINLFKGDHGN